MPSRSFLIVVATLSGVACAGVSALLMLVAGPCIVLGGEGPGEPSLTCVVAARGGGFVAAFAAIVLLLSAAALYLFKPPSR